MHSQEIRNALSQACGQSTIMRKSLFKVMDWLTLKSWHVRREIRKWMRNAPEKAHILDAGSGLGQNAYWLSCQREKYSVLAIDKESSQVCSGNTFVRESHRVNLLFKTIRLEDFEANDAFDLILCTGSLENTEDDQKALNNLHGALREGGMIITTVNRKYRESDTSQTHAKRFGYHMDELKSLFRETGFHHVKAHYTAGRAGQTAQKLGIKFPMRLLNLSRAFALLLPFYYLFVIPVVAVLNWLDSHTAIGSGQGILLLAKK